MINAEVKQVDFNSKTRQITITIDAKDTIFVQEPLKGQMGFPMLMNGSVLVEGFNLILEHHFNAINAIKEHCK